MLIEVYTYDYENIISFLKENNYDYFVTLQISKKTNPCWDGTHNDYLFIDNHMNSIIFINNSV